MLISDWSSDVCSSDLAPSIDVVTRQAVERGFFVIGRDRRPRIDEALRIKGPDRPCAGLAIAAGIRPQHDLKTVASVDRKRQSSGEIVFILVSPSRNDVAVDAVTLVGKQGETASDARSERPRNRATKRALLIISDCEPQRAGQILRWHLGDDVERAAGGVATEEKDRKSTRLNSSH